MAEAARSYGQMCPIARSLDVLGERWTLLIVRELLLGPKRFKDLLDALPSMGTNRLSDRLKTLEAADVVQRTTLPAPSGAQVYALTERGEALRVPVVALAQWGAGLPIGERIDHTTARADLLALVRCATVSPAAIADDREIYDLTVGEECFHIIAGDGRALPRSGPAPVSADVIMRCDLPTLIGLDSGALTAAAARRDRRATIDGRAPAVKRLLAIFRSPRRP